MPKVRGVVAATIIAGVMAGAVGGGCGRHAAPSAGLETMAGRTKARPAMRPTVRTPPPPALPDPADRAALAEMIRQQAVDTQKILDGETAAPPLNRPTTAPPSTQHAAVDRPASPPATSSSTPPTAAGVSALSAPAVAPPAPVLTAAPAPVPSIDDRVRDAADRLGDALQEQAKATPSLRVRAAMAALDALQLRPATAPADPDLLTPSQRQALDGLREAIGTFATPDGPEAAEPERLADQLRSLADRLDASRGLSISDLRLCTRVRGFGQFTTFPQFGAGPDAAARLIAGGTSRALVYVELDRFAHRAIDSGDPELAAARDRGEQWVVDLSQEINLYSERGNLLVHRRPAERVIETSRSRRRDFYLVTEITLPPTLGTGIYHLKVTVRDRTSDAVAERSLPIEIVADTALVQGDSR